MLKMSYRKRTCLFGWTFCGFGASIKPFSLQQWVLSQFFTEHSVIFVLLPGVVSLALALEGVCALRLPGRSEWPSHNFRRRLHLVSIGVESVQQALLWWVREWRIILVIRTGVKYFYRIYCWIGEPTSWHWSVVVTWSWGVSLVLSVHYQLRHSADKRKVICVVMSSADRTRIPNPEYPSVKLHCLSAAVMVQNTTRVWNTIRLTHFLSSYGFGRLRKANNKTSCTGSGSGRLVIRHWIGMHTM